MPYCSACGRANPGDAAFCNACGRGFDPKYTPRVPVHPTGLYHPPFFVKARNEGLFIASMILGICGLMFYPAGIILGALAIIFYCAGLSRLAQNPELTGKGMGIAGLVTGIIAVVFSSLFWLMVLISVLYGFENA